MSNFTLRDLEKRVQERAKASAHTSYTRRLLDQGVAHCAKKLGEEAIETVLAAARSDAIKARLRAQTEEAQRLGLFGAPSFTTADGELFWGNDRLEQAVRWHAQHRT